MRAARAAELVMQAWLCAVTAVCLDGFFVSLLFPVFLFLFSWIGEDENKLIWSMFGITFILHTAAGAMVIVKTVRLKKLLHPAQTGMAMAV
jgi:hypothetical protein